MENWFQVEGSWGGWPWTQMRSPLHVSLFIPASLARYWDRQGKTPNCLRSDSICSPATDYYWIGNLEKCTWTASEDQIWVQTLDSPLVVCVILGKSEYAFEPQLLHTSMGDENSWSRIVVRITEKVWSVPSTVLTQQGPVNGHLISWFLPGEGEGERSQSKVKMIEIVLAFASTLGYKGI